MSDWISGLQKSMAPTKPPAGSFTASDVARRLKCPLSTACDYLRAGIIKGELDRVRIKPEGSRNHIFFYFEKPKPAPKKR